MPVYEYYCAKCGSKYEELRPMRRSGEPGTCPKRRGGGARTLSVFAAVGNGGTAVAGAEPSAGGGCACDGDACGCH